MTRIFSFAVLIAVAALTGTPTDLWAQTAGANSFNRLFRPPPKANLAPSEDGIHDPSSPGTPELQAPLEAFGALDKSDHGNHVDWFTSSQSKKIQTVWDIAKPNEKPDAMDLNIVREVKGSTPNVVFSHERHGQILDCANCHPVIFKAEKGANPMSMASLALGQACGVCHGRVAFPNAECRKCHSQPKGEATAMKAGTKKK